LKSRKELYEEIMSLKRRLIQSLREISISIGYGIWTGIGAAGSVLLGIYVFKEPKDIRKLALVGGIIISIVGLKFTS